MWGQNFKFPSIRCWIVKKGSIWPTKPNKFRCLLGQKNIFQQSKSPEKIQFEYSLSPFAIYDTKFGRGNYLSNGIVEPKSFTKGHLFGPPELAIRKQEDYSVKVSEPNMGSKMKLRGHDNSVYFQFGLQVRLNIL